MSMDRQERKRQEILSQIMGESMVYDKMFSACMQNNRRAFEIPGIKRPGEEGGIRSPSYTA